MKNRYSRAGLTAADVTLSATARTARILWLQVTAFCGAIFCLVLAAALAQEWRMPSPTSHRVKLVSGAVLLAGFVWFSVSNFWRARRLQRS